MRSRLGAAAFVIGLFTAAGAGAAGTSPRVTLHAGAHAFDVEIAATPQQRQLGLMGRKHLADGAGMLFTFEQRDRHCFWMKNTLVPLSIAFLADDGTMVHIADMQPQSLDLHCPPTAVRYALEVRQGGFSARGLRAGSRVTGGPFGSRP